MCKTIFSLIFAAVLATSAAFGQFEPSSVAKPTAAPVPVVTPAPAPAPATPVVTPAPDATPTVALTEDRVREMVKEGLKTLPKPPAAVTNEDSVARATANRAEEKVDTINRWVRNIVIAVVIVLLVALIVWFFKRRRKGNLAASANAATHAVVLLALFAATVNAQTCYNTITGKTPGSVKQSIAVVGMNNEFVCSGSGSVEITKLDGSALLTPTVIKPSPLTFTFTPATANRAIIKIAGKPVSALAIVADPDQAFLVGSAIDLAPAKPDATARAMAAATKTELINVNGRIKEVESRVSKLEAKTEVIADAHNSLESRVKAVEATPAFDDTNLRAELSRTNAALTALNNKVNAMGQDLAATDKVANEALAIAHNAQTEVTRLRWVTEKKGTKGERKLLKDPGLKK